MRSDHELLAHYVSSRCEDSFRLLVDRHIGLVHSTALRTIHNHSLASEVSQQVFTKLACYPESVPISLPLPSWLHRTTHSLSVNTVRSEERRRRREQTATSLTHMKPSNTEWEKLSPVIDSALEALGANDRNIILLRFYEELPHETIGKRLGLSGDASRKRVARALTKLQKILSKKGVTTSTSTLGITLASYPWSTAPNGLAASISSTAITTAGSLSSHTLLLTSLIMKAKSIGLPVACLTLLTIPIWQQNTITALQKEHEKQASLPLDFQSLVHSSRTNETQSSKITNPAIIAFQLARIVDPMERDAALAEWADQFTTNDEIITVLETLKKDPLAETLLLSLIAPHLTRQWALVAPNKCIHAFIDAAASKNSNPFGISNFNYSNGSYFTLVATTNPSAFTQWSATASDELHEAFFAKNDDQLTRSADLIFVTLARLSPELLIELATKHPDNTQAQTLLDQSNLHPALIAHHPEQDQLWNLISKLPTNPSSIRLQRKISQGYIEDNTQPFSDILSEITQRPAGPRQVYELESLAKQLIPQDPNPSELTSDELVEKFDKINALVEFINGTQAVNNPVYDSTRAHLAAASVEHDLEGALQWGDSIIDKKTRLTLATDLAAILASGTPQKTTSFTINSAEDNNELKHDLHVSTALGEEMSIKFIPPHEGVSPDLPMKDILNHVQENLSKRLQESGSPPGELNIRFGE